MLHQMTSTSGTDTCSCPQTKSSTGRLVPPSQTNTDTCIKLKKEPSTSMLYKRSESNVKHCSSEFQNEPKTGPEKKTDYKMNMRLTYYPPGTSPRYKVDQKKQNGKDVCQCSSSCAIPTVMSKEKNSSSNTYCIPLAKHEETVQELQVMKQKCDQMEITVEKLRTLLERNRVAIQDMTQSKKLALDMAKQLREKCETMRTSRKALMTQVERLKLENSGLSTEVEKDLMLRKNLNEQVKSLKEEIEIANNARKDAEQEIKQLQCKLCCTEKKLKETEAHLLSKDQELNKRLSADSPEVQEIVQHKTAELQARIDEQAKTYNSTLERKIKELHDVQCQCVSLENKLKSTQDADDKKYAQTEAEFAKYKASTKKKENLLLAESEELKKVILELTNLLKENENKYSETEKEFKKYRTLTEEKQALMEKERDELKKLIQELKDMLKQNKIRIEELSNINKQQESLIQSQTDVISSKEQQMNLSNEEMEEMNQQINELENQVIILRSSVDMYEKMKEDWTHKCCHYEKDDKKHDAKKQALEKGIRCCRCALDADKEELLIKTKIIDSQNESIKKLKASLNEKSEELRRMTKELEQAEKEITQNKLNKQKLLNKISLLQRTREHLEEQVTELEDELDKNPSVHQKLQELEMQVDGKQKEWELQLKVLTHEKEQALKAARFAAEKLFETTNQFQKQVSIQRKVQRMLTTLLSEKEAQLKAASEQEPLVCLCQKPKYEPVVCTKRPASISRLLKQYSNSKCR